MEIGQLSAFSGLLQGSSATERSQRELASLERLGHQVKKDQNEEMMFQELEAQQYEEIKQQAAVLAQPDRDRITKKLHEFQRSMKDQIKNYGSYRRFMQNGGVSILKKGKTDLLYSDEFSKYRDNKENLERILRAKEAGKGGLLSRVDMRNMSDYHSGKTDTVTYSGLKTEVEIPEDSFMLGQELTPEDILNHKDNYMKIYTNFILDHPDEAGLAYGSPELTGRLRRYTEENYKGQGKNKAALEHQRAMHKLETDRMKAANAGTGNKGGKSAYTEVSNVLLNSNNISPWTAGNIMAGADGTKKNYWDTVRNVDGIDNPMYKKYGLTDSYNEAHPIRERNLLGQSVRNMLDPRRYELASSLKFSPQLNEKFNQGFYGDTEEAKRGQVTVDVSSGNFHKVNGSSASEDGRSYNGTYKNIGWTKGWVDENGNIATNVVNKEGEIITDGASSQADRVSNPDAQMTPVMISILKNDDDMVLYEKFDDNNIFSVKAMQLAFGSLDNIADVEKQTKEFNKETNAVSAEIKLEEKQIMNEVNKASQGSFNNDYFVSESKNISSNQKDNTLLLKSFYMSQSKVMAKEYNSLPNTQKVPEYFTNDFLSQSGLVERNAFTEVLNFFPNLQKRLFDNEFSDEQFIDELVRALSAETDDPNDERYQDYQSTPHYIDNLRLGTSWKEHLRILKNS